VKRDLKRTEEGEEKRLEERASPESWCGNNEKSAPKRERIRLGGNNSQEGGIRGIKIVLREKGYLGVKSGSWGRKTKILEKMS